MSTIDASSAGSRQRPDIMGPRCYVVSILMTGRQIGLLQSGSGLPKDLSESLKGGVLSWRDKNVVRSLRAIMRERQLPGLALQYAARKKSVPDIPPPATVTFEPIPLDETHPSLEYLAASGERQENAVARKRARVVKRMMVRYGIPLVLVIQLFANALPQAFIHGWHRWTSWLFVGSMIAALLGILVYNWYRQHLLEWILVPGGVVVRKSRLLASGSSIELLTPANSLLLIRPAQTGWSARLYPHTSMRPYTTSLTELERSALLATWQSSVPTPEPEMLRELI